MEHYYALVKSSSSIDPLNINKATVTFTLLKNNAAILWYKRQQSDHILEA